MYRAPSLPTSRRASVLAAACSTVIAVAVVSATAALFQSRGVPFDPVAVQARARATPAPIGRAASPRIYTASPAATPDAQAHWKL